MNPRRSVPALRPRAAYATAVPHNSPSPTSGAPCTPGRPPARPRCGAALLLLLALLLAACDPARPRLATSADSLSEATLSSASLVLSNAGGGRLEWRATVDNPNVELVPERGSIDAGRSATLNLVVAGTVADPEVPLNALLSITSNGGSKAIPLSYGAVATCGRQPLASAADGGAVPVGDEVIVGYAAPSGLTSQSLASLADGARTALSAEHGLALLAVGDGTLPDLFVAPPGSDVDALVARLAADPRVAFAQRNYYVELQLAPNDPYYGSQWALASFGLEQAWDVQRGQGRRVVVAVIDSGVERDHPDLAGKVLPGYDFYKNAPGAAPYAVPASNAYYQKVSHGTHVAGIVAAWGDDGVGVAGVAFGADVVVLPIKLFDDCGSHATVDALAKAIRWAAGLPVPGAPLNPDAADVINLSLGVAGRHPALDAAAQAAWDAGAVLVAAAGNHGASGANPGVLSPANAPSVIAVGSVDEGRLRSAFSNHGPELELMAPGGFGRLTADPSGTCADERGVGVLSAVPVGAHGCMIGTSMAAPFVSGVAALLIAQGEHVAPAQVRARLRETALRGAGTSEDGYGYGIVCADAALGAATVCGAAP